MRNLKFILMLMLISAIAIGCGATKKSAQKTATDLVKVGDMDNPPGTIMFDAANDRYTAEGTFKKWNFTDVNMTGADLTTMTANAKIDLTSIWEHSDKLTEHLKANDYFDVEKYTTANLSIANVVAGMNNEYTADMELKMRGKTQKLPAEFKVTSKKPLKIRGTASVDRSIFGIGVENEGVPDMIKVRFETLLPM